MDQVQRNGWWPALVSRHVGILAALIAIVTAGGCTQQTSNKKPSTHEYVQHVNKQLREAEDADPSVAKYTRVFRAWVVVAVIATAVVAAALVLRFAVGWFVRASARTDPARLALTDPWIREQLARQHAAEPSAGEGPTPPPEQDA